MNEDIEKTPDNEPTTFPADTFGSPEESVVATTEIENTSAPNNFSPRDQETPQPVSVLPINTVTPATPKKEHKTAVIVLSVLLVLVLIGAGVGAYFYRNYTHDQLSDKDSQIKQLQTKNTSATASLEKDNAALTDENTKLKNENTTLTKDNATLTQKNKDQAVTITTLNAAQTDKSSTNTRTTNGDSSSTKKTH